MASKQTLWNKLGKYISALVIGCFFLPFFGVSCDGMDVVTVSGADMVGGCKPGGLISAAEDEVSDRGSGGDDDMGSMSGSLTPKVDKVEREPLAIVALALIVLVFGASLVRTRPALIGALVLSIACLGTLAGLYVKVNGTITDAVEKELKSKGGEMTRDTKIDAGGRMGLWGTCFGLLVIAGLSGMALREKPDAAT